MWLLLHCFAGATPPSTWALRNVSLLDPSAGRYTQVRLAPDGNATMIWNAVGATAGLRLSRCLDDSCLAWSPPATISGVDTNPRFMRMELLAAQPIVVFAAADGRELHAVRCADAACAALGARAALARTEKVRYNDVRLLHNELLVAVSLSNITHPGVELYLLRVNADDLSVRDRSLVARSDVPFGINESTSFPTGGLEAPCLLVGDDGAADVAYWDVVGRRLALVWDAGSPNATTATVAAASSPRSNPGAWVRGVRVGGTLMLAYFDLPAAELRLVRCERATRRCDAPRLLDGAVAQGDYTDYGAGAFPEMRVGPDGNPVLVYFSTAAVTGAGELRAAFCADARCESVGVRTLATGRAGFGRDASVAFASAGGELAMMVTLLDRGLGNASDATARLAVLTP